MSSQFSNIVCMFLQASKTNKRITLHSFISLQTLYIFNLCSKTNGYIYITLLYQTLLMLGYLILNAT